MMEIQGTHVWISLVLFLSITTIVVSLPFGPDSVNLPLTSSFSLRPDAEMFRACNTSLLTEAYLDPVEPLRQSHMDPGHGLYTSHVKDTASMWCGEGGEGGTTFTLEFYFDDPMLVTAVQINANLSQINGNLSDIIANLSDPSSSTQLSFGYYLGTSKGYRWTDYSAYGTVMSAEEGGLLTTPVITDAVQLNITSNTTVCEQIDVRGCYPGKLTCQQSPFLHQWGGHCYAVSETSIYTRHQADAQCSSMGATLVVIETEAERDFMETLVPASYFMALFREQDFSQTWHEGNSKVPLTFTLWDDFEPYGPEYYDTDSDQHTSYRGVIQSENFMWAETRDNDTAAYICKKTNQSNLTCDYFLWNDQCYYVNTTAVAGMDQASALCGRLGYELVTIYTWEEQEFLNSILLGAPWTGLELSSSGQFEYYGTELRQMGWQYWQTDLTTGEANPSGYPIELDCVLLEAVEGVAGHVLKDLNCTQDHAFVCQKNSSDTEECPEAWLREDYSLGCLRLFTTPLSWFEAWSVCESLGAKLVNPESITNSSVFNKKIWHGYWFGLQGYNYSGSYAWALASGQSTTLNNFHNFQSLSAMEAQINSLGVEDYCVYAGAEGWWSVNLCSQTFPSVCADDHVLPASDKPLSNLKDVTGVTMPLSEADILLTCNALPNCQSSFTYNGQSITGCTFSGSISAWCSRQTQYTKYYVETCSCIYDYNVRCELHPSCVESFLYGGKSYNGCSMDNDIQYWCSQVDNLSSYSTQFTYCTCEKVYDPVKTDPTVALPTPVRFWILTEEHGNLDLTNNEGHLKLLSVQFFPVQDPFTNEVLSIVQQDKDNSSRLIIGNSDRLFTDTSFCFVTYIMWPNVVEDSMILEFGNAKAHSTQEFIAQGLYMRIENRTLVVHALNALDNQQSGIPVTGVLLTPDEWHHIGLCYDKTSVMVSVWVNQTLETTFTAPDIQSYVDYDLISIGYRKYEQNYYYKTTARYYCMTIYSKVLNQVQMNAAAHLCSNITIQPINSTTVCEHDVTLLECSGTSKINIVYAEFGNEPETGFCTEDSNITHSNSYCLMDMTAEVKDKCQRQKSCIFRVNMDTFFSSSYSNYKCDVSPSKLLQLKWNCEETAPCVETNESSGVYRDGWCYYVNDKERTDWNTAQFQCVSEHNNNLVSITSEQIQQNLNEIMPSSVWTEMNDLEVEDKFVDATGSEVYQKTWAEGYPMQASLVEKCVQVAFENNKIVMNDVQCSQNRSYICKSWYSASICSRTVLHAGELLYIGDSLCTEDGKYTAVLQHDGVFVLKGPDEQIKYASQTEGSPVVSVNLTLDGRLLLLSASGASSQLAAVYTTDTSLSISPDGYLVLLSSRGSVLWSSTQHDCSRTVSGFDYLGTRSQSEEGWNCESWIHEDLQRFEFSEFPDGSSQNAASFCRNMASLTKDTPGCYVDMGSETLQYRDCDIPQCGNGYSGQRLSGEICTSVFDGLLASETFFYPPGYEAPDTKHAANALHGTPEIDGEQKGGVCLKAWGDGYPTYLEIRLPEKQFITGVNITRQADGTGPLYKGVTIQYSRNNVTWATAGSLLTKSNLIAAYSGEGRVEFDTVIEASLLRVFPHCHEDESSSCFYAVQCFRIDLLRCTANLVHGNLYPSFRVPTYDSIIQEVFLDEMVTTAMYHPAITVQLTTTVMVLGVSLTASESVTMSSRVTVEVHPESPVDLLTPEIVTSEDHVCGTTDYPVPEGSTVTVWCQQRLLEGKVVFIYSSAVDDVLAFSDIDTFVPRYPSTFESDYNSAVANGESALFEFFATFPITGSITSTAHRRYKKTAEEDGYEPSTVPSGLLNDGLYMGGCLTLTTRDNPWLHVDLGEPRWVAEVRLTASEEPEDMLLNLNIHINNEYDLLLNENPANCYENNVAFTPGETRSLMCYKAVHGQHVYLYKIESAARLSLCEVEIFRHGEQTDIPAPTWQSDWSDLPYQAAIVVPHGLGVLPIYGRILLNSGRFHEHYFYETGYFIATKLKDTYDIQGLILFAYTESNYKLEWEDEAFSKMHCLNSTKYNHAMTNHLCFYKEDFRYKVQLWSECAFPRPTFMTPWTTAVNGTSVLPHNLGVIPEFGYIQVTMHEGITFQISHSKHSVEAYLMYTSTDYIVHFDQFVVPDVKEIRIILWHKLGQMRPLFSQTFDITDGAGPEKLRLPPYSPENSIIYLTLHTLDPDTGVPSMSSQGNSLGQLTTLMAYNEEFLLIWWQEAAGDMDWSQVTVTVYNTGFSNSTDVCQPLTVNNTNVYSECSKDEVYLYNNSDVYTFNCDVNIGTWSIEYNKELEWNAFQGYEYAMLTGEMSYQNGVEECKSHDAHVMALQSHDQIDFLMKKILLHVEYTNPNITEPVNRTAYVDAWRSHFEVFGEDWSAVYPVIYGFYESSCLMIDAVMDFQEKVPVFTHTFHTVDCNVSLVTICQRLVCPEQNKLLAVPHKYRTPPDDPEMVLDSMKTSAQCHKQCLIHDCAWSMLDSVSDTCSLYSTTSDLHNNSTPWYGQHTTFDYRCKRVKEPAWELFSSLNTSRYDDFSLTELLTNTRGVGDNILSYPAEMEQFNLTHYKKPDRHGWGNFLQWKLSMSSSGGEQAFAIFQFNRQWLDHDFVIYSLNGASLNLSIKELNSSLTLSCMPADDVLENRNFLLSSSSCPCDGDQDEHTIENAPTGSGISPILTSENQNAAGSLCGEHPYAAYKKEICRDVFTKVTSMASNVNVLPFGNLTQESCEALCTGRFNDVCVAYDFSASYFCHIIIGDPVLVPTIGDHYIRSQNCTQEWIETDTVSVYVNRYCLVNIFPLSSDTLNLDAYGITLEDTSFLTAKLNEFTCDSHQLSFHQYADSWDKRAFFFVFNSPENYIQFSEIVEGYYQRKWRYVPNLAFDCFETFWFQWQFDTFEFGVGEIYDEETILASFDIEIEITVKYANIYSGQGVYSFPRPSSCHPLKLQNVTDTYSSFCDFIVKCKDNYELLDGGTEYYTECFLNGTWSHVEDCALKVCRNLSVDNSDAFEENISYGESITVECDPHYSVLELNYTTNFTTFCQSDKTFAPVYTCTSLPCHELTVEHSNATLVVGDWHDEIVVQCEPGYELESEATAYNTMCLPNLTWSQNLTCRAKVCGNLTVENSNTTNNFGWYGTEPVVVLCHEGYTGLGYAQSFPTFCNASGLWEYSDPCYRVSCPVSPYGPGIEAIPTGANFPSFILYEDEVQYRCQSGFSAMSGNPNVTCLADGSTSSLPFCVEDCLSVDPIPQMMSVMVTLDNETGLFEEMGSTHNRYSSVLSVSCNHLYEVEGSPNLTCLATGIWSHPMPSCRMIDCGAPADKEGIVIATNSPSTTVESIITYECVPGFGAIEGNQSILCQLNGQWTEAPVCYLDCPVLASPAFGSVSSDSVTSGSVVTVVCVNLTYYMADGQDSIMCGKDGLWNTTLPNCTHVPVPGVWLAWGGWGECSEACGVGEQTRTRECTDPQYGGPTCTGSPVENRACELAPCNVDGVWAVWSFWSECTASCEGGTRRSVRECLGQSGTGLPCAGISLLESQCQLQACPIVSCHTPPHAAHTVQTGPSRQIGSVVVYQCEDPTLREFPDGSKEKVIQCSKFGTWDPYTVPPCQYKQCPEIPLPAHAVRDREERFLFTTTEYSCQVGYRLPDLTDRTTIYCQEDQTWTSIPPHCIAKECLVTQNYHQPISHAVLDFSFHIIGYGDVLQMPCEENHRVNTGRTELDMKCEASMPHLTFSCESYYCEPPPAVDNALVNVYNYSHVVYQCIEGHRFQDGHRSKTITCDKATWSEVIIKPCSIITCPPVPEVEFASANDSSAVYGTVVEYTCFPGYILPDKTYKHSISCQDNREWSNMEGLTCEEVICGEPVVVGHATRDYTEVSLQAKAHYSCDASHRFSDGYTHKTITCTETGDWQPIDAACDVERCEPVPVALNSVPNTTLAITDTVVSISCDPGYTLLDSEDQVQTTRCDRDTRQWTVQPDACTATQCSALPFSAPVMLSNDDTFYPVAVNITCDHGYSLNVTSIEDFSEDFITVECLPHGQWNGSIESISCQKVTCPPLHPIPQAHTNSSGSEFGDQSIVECHHGFIFLATKETSKLIKCTAEGLWDAQISEGCELIQCPSVSLWYNTLTNTTESLFSTYAHVECEQGYSFASGDQQDVGVAIVTHCGNTGVWSPTVPGCQSAGQSFSQLYEPVEAEGSRQIGFLSTLAFVSVFTAIIVIDIITYWRVAVYILSKNLPFLKPLLDDLQKYWSKPQSQRGQEYELDRDEMNGQQPDEGDDQQTDQAEQEEDTVDTDQSQEDVDEQPNREDVQPSKESQLQEPGSDPSQANQLNSDPSQENQLDSDPSQANQPDIDPSQGNEDTQPDVDLSQEN